MGVEQVKTYFQSLGMAERVREFQVSSATVELAAQALGCEPQRIAKTLSFQVGQETVLIVAAGDCRIDNSLFKAVFHTKAKMLSAAQVEERTGHPVGGVCPFAVKEGVDLSGESLKRLIRYIRLAEARTAQLSLQSKSWSSAVPAAAGFGSASS